MKELERGEEQKSVRVFRLESSGRNWRGRAPDVFQEERRRERWREKCREA